MGMSSQMSSQAGSFSQIKLALSLCASPSPSPCPPYLQPSPVTSPGELPCNIPIRPSLTQFHHCTHAPTATQRQCLNSVKVVFVLCPHTHIVQHAGASCTILLLMNIIVFYGYFTQLWDHSPDHCRFFSGLLCSYARYSCSRNSWPDRL